MQETSNNPLRYATNSISLVAFLYYLNTTNTRRARCAPNKHYEIPFVRGIPCSSLYPIHIKTPQTTIARFRYFKFRRKNSYTAKAAFLFIPSTLSSSSNSATLIASKFPKCLYNAFLRLGPIPSI